MLMSEQDYADIGLPKEPRTKLLNSMRRLRTNTPQSPPQQTQPPPLLKHINPQPLWNSSVENVLPNHLHPDNRIPPGLRHDPFPGTPQLAVSLFLFFHFLYFVTIIFTSKTDRVWKVRFYIVFLFCLKQNIIIVSFASCFRLPGKLGAIMLTSNLFNVSL